MHVTNHAKGQVRLRNDSLRVVSQAIFSAGQPVSRVELAEETGLTRATVARLVDELEAAGIVEELPIVRQTAQGRPSALFQPCGGSQTLGIGLEVNVDYVAGRSLNLRGEVVGEFVVEGDFRGVAPAKALSFLRERFVELLGEGGQDSARIAGVTLAVPGIVSAEEGCLLVAPNLDWHNEPLLDLARSALDIPQDCPLIVDNDANFQGFGEAHLGPGRKGGESTFLYVVGDRGIGAAIIVDGVVERGQSGWAGEIGHMCVDVGGPACFCGSAGCLERYVGMSVLLENAGFDPVVNSVDDLVEALGFEDPVALRAVSVGCEALAVVLANVVNLLDVSRVVLGTGFARIGPWILPVLSEAMTAMVIGHPQREVSITAAPPSVFPACTGGAILALQRIVEDPGEWIDGDV